MEGCQERAQTCSLHGSLTSRQLQMRGCVVLMDMNQYWAFPYPWCFYDHLSACSLVAKLGRRWLLMMMLAWKKSQKILDITSKWDPKHGECGQMTCYAIIGNCISGNGNVHVFHYLMGHERIWIPYPGALHIIMYDRWLYCIIVKGIFIHFILWRPISSMVPFYIDLQDAGLPCPPFLGLFCSGNKRRHLLTNRKQIF